MKLDSPTYSLLNDSQSSENLYLNISKLADKVRLKADPFFSGIIKSFKDFISFSEIEDKKSDDEYLVELITIGILWQNYSQFSTKLPKWKSLILKNISLFREKYRKIGKLTGFIRKLLLSDNFPYQDEYEGNILSPTKQNLQRFSNWLYASGEYLQKAKRFDIWKFYWHTKNITQIENDFKNLNEFTKWFNDQLKTQNSFSVEKMGESY